MRANDAKGVYSGKRMEVMGLDGKIMYISEKHYKAIHNKKFLKAYVVKEYPVQGKLIIEYTSRDGHIKGVMELYDIGPKSK
ncbi:hypothetical protein [Geosporobacter ferrireducens]|uniref:hypothetical protein n=1 Tax=Geosporobacter ferrireducens TaxID=1424294 RepID=UPI00139C939D|nr:hypothetical protein [Geosporobacter ferrireducens]MTI56129.1 hypothetical protein [Geosporobacter ferrireducens]